MILVVLVFLHWFFAQVFLDLCSVLVVLHWLLVRLMYNLGWLCDWLWLVSSVFMLFSSHHTQAFAFL